MKWYKKSNHRIGFWSAWPLQYLIVLDPEGHRGGCFYELVVRESGVMVLQILWK